LFFPVLITGGRNSLCERGAKPITPNKMTVLTETNIFRSDEMAIDFFTFGNTPSENIAITFTPFGVDGAVSLHGVGYGGELLLRNGFDVIAFKSSKNLWYQNVSHEMITAVDKFIDAHQISYAKRVGYGSSMGGYAAIQFSKSLGLDIVLALSPQFEIDKSYDQRWQTAASLIEFHHRIDAKTISTECKYFVAYDPGTIDVRHIEKLRELIDPKSLVEIPTPFSGHPVGHFLAETGLIQKFALSILKYGSVEEVSRGRQRRHSKIYLFELSKQLALRKKNRSALVAIDNAISIDDQGPEFYVHRSVILDALNQPKLALLAAHEARRKLKQDPYMMGALSERLARHGDFDVARTLIEKAINIDASVVHFHLHKCDVCKTLGDLPAAIYAGECAIKLSPNDAKLMVRVAKLHAAHGGVAHWARSAVLATSAIFSFFG